jgi:hypothetical protein
MHMMVEVQVVLTPFLAFTSSYNVSKAHTMLTLMLDMCFKSLDAVKVFVGQEKVIQIGVEYDSKTALPLLAVVLHFLNPTNDGFIQATPIDDDSIFGVVTSNEATLHGLLKNELGLFRRLHVKLKDFFIALNLVEIP